jgi:hypothetical protein
MNEEHTAYSIPQPDGRTQIIVVLLVFRADYNGSRLGVRCEAVTIVAVVLDEVGSWRVHIHVCHPLWNTKTGYD